MFTGHVIMSYNVVVNKISVQLVVFLAKMLASNQQWTTLHMYTVQVYLSTSTSDMHEYPLNRC